MPFLPMKQHYVREAVAEIQRRLSLPDDAIRIDPMYIDSVLVDFRIRNSSRADGDVIQEVFTNLCARHGWQPPHIETWDDRRAARPYIVELRKTGSLSKSPALLPE